MRHADTPPASRYERVALFGGVAAGAIQLLFSGLFFGYILPALPPLDAPAAQIAAFYAVQSQNTIYHLTSFLLEAQMLPLALFFGGLYAVLRRHEGAGGALSAAVLAAGMAISTIIPVVDMIEDHLLLGLAAAGGDPLTVRVFDGIVPQAQALNGFPQALVLAGTAALIFGHGFAPRWLAWAGLALAALSLLGTGTILTAAMFPASALSALLFEIWVLALSVALLRGTAHATRPLAQPAA
jgi:hypothetical protein